VEEVKKDDSLVSSLSSNVDNDRESDDFELACVGREHMDNTDFTVDEASLLSSSGVNVSSKHLLFLFD
jgi:hypothetical protein